MDYSDTVNLPDTNFSMQANLSENEPDRLKKWNQENLYDSILKNRDGNEKFILHDGPPYANGDIHLGHALNKILKDILVKFKSMQGFNAPYRPGWDCHGLPIEHKVTSEQPETVEEGRMAVREACREYALEYVDVQKEQFKRLGVLGEWDDPYLTLSPDYEASILDSFLELVRMDYVYRQLKPIHWCWDCNTALAEAEVEYDEITSPAVYVDFPVIEDPNDVLESGDSNVMIWTTTPWTLPANVAIAAHPDLTYIEFRDPDGKVHIVAEPLLSVTISPKDWTTTGIEILQEIQGQKLEGLVCENPLIDDRNPEVITGDIVTTEQGTGFVHIAPGHGQEDYALGQEYDLDIVSPVNEDGLFTDEYPPQQGVHVLTAQDNITEELDEIGALFFHEEFDHSYPFCWRCGKPVIFRATPQWFLDVDHNDLRNQILDELENINWLPERGERRFRAMMEDRPDWCLSRQRAWGVPIPALSCDDCGEVFIDESVIEQLIPKVEENGVNVWFEGSLLEILPENFGCPSCDSQNLTKQDDILDVWFDSGVSHQAVLRKDDNLRFPADVYLEGSDQHRGWFQLSMIPGMALEGQSPFRELITHGFVMDAEGKKMSKSEGNVISPQEVVQENGADILRLWVASEDYQEDLVIGQELIEQLKDKYRRIRNTCKFFLGNLQDFDGFDPEKDLMDVNELEPIDRWFLSELYGLIRRVSRAYQEREFHQAINQVNDFCAVEASSLYLDVSKDRLYCEAPDSDRRRSAQTALYHSLRAITRIIAPVLAFTADEVWDYLPTDDSVHLEDWPEAREEWMDDRIMEEFEILRELRKDVMRKIENHDQLSESDETHLRLSAPGQEELLQSHEDLLEEWFLVAEVELVTDGDGKEIQVSPSNHSKCDRCWRYRPDVTAVRELDGDELCDRCHAVIRETESETTAARN